MSSRALSGGGAVGPVWESRRKRMGSPFGSSLTSSNRIVLQAAIGAPFWGWTQINYLLQRMEDYRGLAILATNRKGEIDRAFLRRLRFLVDFPFPAAAQRLRIWQKVFPPQTSLGEIDHDALARMA